MKTVIELAGWQAENRQDLNYRLAKVRNCLLRALDRSPERLPEPPPEGSLSAASLLAALFGLSEFETDLLMLCAAVEMDAAVGRLCAEFSAGGGDVAFATPGLALSTLPGAHWSALSPGAPLRYWRLVDLDERGGLTRAPLRVSERILHFLAGVAGLDAGLEGLVEPVPPQHHVPALGNDREAGRAAYLLDSPEPPVVYLTGADSATRLSVAWGTAEKLERRLFLLRASDLPVDPVERHGLARLWEREARLTGGLLLVEMDGGTGVPGGPREMAACGAFLSEGGFPALVTADLPVPFPVRRQVVRLAVELPPTSERETAWQDALGDRGAWLNGFVPVLSAQFQLPLALIQAAARDALAGLPENEPAVALEQRLWEACRRQGRPSLDDLAQRVESSRTWDDLVLPDLAKDLLREIAAHVAHRQKVYHTWGYAALERSAGASVIFAGGSGTGKTLAAEVIANQLGLDLYRVDLSGVVSKYIGETEKNLRRIFQAAGYGGAILLFDEADALFGKRSEVKDSHDRYANIEVSYLLQQMETYQGIAILTTNMLENFDRAFLRRVRFVVQFPFPTAEQRAQIWARMFPPAAPTDALDLRKLARLNVTGGSIRSIALNGAFFAADAGEPIRMAHLLKAARSEFGKLERVLPEAEVRDWVARDS